MHLGFQANDATCWLVKVSPGSSSKNPHTAVCMSIFLNIIKSVQPLPIISAGKKKVHKRNVFPVSEHPLHEILRRNYKMAFLL